MMIEKRSQSKIKIWFLSLALLTTQMKIENRFQFYLLTEFGHDDSIDVDRDQLGISNFESVGHYGYQIGPIVESGIEEEDDDEDSIAMEDSAMEDGDKEDNTAGETIFG